MKKISLLVALAILIIAMTLALSACQTTQFEYETNRSDMSTYVITGIGSVTGTDIVIPASINGIPVTAIGDDAFNGCSGIKSVVIPNSVTSIGSQAFRDCTSLTSVTIPDSVTYIGGLSFYECYKLVEVINNSSLNITAGYLRHGYVGYYAKEVHTGESKIVNLNDCLFYTSDEVNYLVAYVGNDTDLILPDDYNGQEYEIYYYAFYGCKSLVSITIPDSITTYNGELSFDGCKSLEGVYYGGEKNKFNELRTEGVYID